MCVTHRVSSEEISFEWLEETTKQLRMELGRYIGHFLVNTQDLCGYIAMVTTNLPINALIHSPSPLLDASEAVQSRWDESMAVFPIMH